MNHDFLSNMKFFMPPFYIFLIIVICIHLYEVLPYLLMDVIQMFKKFFYFNTAYLSFIQLSQFRSIFGTNPIYYLEGDLVVLSLTKLLYENSGCGKIRSHPFNLSPTKYFNKFPKLGFTTFVYPSLCR